MEWIEIFDLSIFRSLLRSTAPIAIVGMAAAMCSAAGVLNIGLEGKMLNAAFAGVYASYTFESVWAGFTAGIIAGLLTAALFGLLSFTAGFFSDPRIVGFEPISVPFLRGTFLEPFLSDFTYSVYLMFVLAILLHTVYYRTRLGTAIRATGENPEAAEDAGINTIRIKWMVTVFSGLLAGISGIFLSLENLTMFTEGMSAGKGYIGLVASSFGNNTPLGTFGASLFFGLGDAIGIRLQGVYELDSRLILMIPYALTVVVLILIGIRQRLRVYIVEDSTHLHKDSVLIVQGDLVKDIVHIESLPEKKPENFNELGEVIISPGFTNAHSHVALNSVKGLGYGSASALYDVMWGIEPALDDDLVYKLSLLGMMDAISSGTTSINDHYFFADSVAKACETIGMRGFIGHTIMTEYGPWTGNEQISLSKSFNNNWKNSKTVHPIVAPHETSTVSHGIAGKPLNTNFLSELNVDWGLGTDCSGGNDDYDMLEEMRTALVLNNSVAKKNFIKPKEVFRKASEENIKRISGGVFSGKLSKNQKADFITVLINTPRMLPLHDVVNNIVMCASSKEINDVYIDGKCVLKNSEFQQIDEQAVLEDGMNALDKIFVKTGFDKKISEGDFL